MTFPDISSMSRYVSPINPAVFPHLSVVLLGIGLFFTAWFFVYEVSRSPVRADLEITISPSVQVTSSKFTRELYKEMLIAAVASVFMGFGTLFLLLWVGIYV